VRAVFYFVHSGGGYAFHPNLDHFGYDIKGPHFPVSADYTNLDHIRKIAREAETYENAVAFNSIGCIKHSLAGPKASVSRWKTEAPLLRGLFIPCECVPKGWLFLPELDSTSEGRDVAKIDAATDKAALSKLLARANSTGAIAFNTGGVWDGRYSGNNGGISKSIGHDGKHGLFVRI
jgi:hypothetical protein